MKTVETPYAEAKRNGLYLPPMEGYAVLREFAGGRFVYPAGLEGRHGDIRYTPLECDKEPSYAYKRRPY